MFEVKESSANYLDVKVTGKVDKAEYRKILTELEDKLKFTDEVDLLVDMSDLDKMTFGAMWEDLKFDVKNFRVIRKFAIIGNEDDRGVLATISEPFVTDEARFFPISKVESARSWIK
ncbi:MAG: hypothetical protein CME62_12965 [Halobacteriovoraceae bacterium]|nr:hypothetical protein [Halobacteriovoraceae bacterium]|tara:strand:- start:2102 stop:2452 length:351 start_codon:yes stop_codon:yes gene_type:complete